MSRKPQHGEHNGNSKLSEEEVKKIKALKGTMQRKQVAAQFNVSPTLIGMIWQGQRRSKG